MTTPGSANPTALGVLARAFISNRIGASTGGINSPCISSGHVFHSSKRVTSKIPSSLNEPGPHRAVVSKVGCLSSSGRTLRTRPARSVKNKSQGGHLFCMTAATVDRRAVMEGGIKMERKQSAIRRSTFAPFSSRSASLGTVRLRQTGLSPPNLCTFSKRANSSSSQSQPQPTSVIKELMRSPDIYSPNFKPPKYKVVLCHGLYGYGVKGKPGSQIHYWANVQDVLMECGVDLLVVEVPSTGSIKERAKILHETLEKSCPGEEINFLAHSMGGLDCRYIITHIKNRSYKIKSLTCIATPHRGSPFMDWCNATIGLGVPAASEPITIKNPSPKLVPAWSLKYPLLSPLPTIQAEPKEPPSSNAPCPESTVQTTSSYFSFIPSSLMSVNPAQILSFIRDRLLYLCDSPAYYNLTTSFCNDYFNPTTPDDPDVRYFSIAARAISINPLHPLWWTKLVLDHTALAGEAERDGFAGEKYEGNDGMVSVSSAKWGEFLGIVDDCNHWELRARNNFFERMIFRFPVLLTPNFSSALSSVYDSSSTPIPASSSPSSSTSIPTIPSSHASTSISSTPTSSAATFTTSQGGQGKLTFSPSTSELHSMPPTDGGWTLPDINASVSSYIESSKSLFGANATPSTDPTSSPKTTSSSLRSSSSDNKIKQVEKQTNSFYESQVSSALGKVAKYLPFPFGGLGKTPDGEQGTPVDTQAREKKEGVEEKFELGRFYRAVVSHLHQRGL
ncbi:E [Phaffia rhodozyma]|uniref:E n=1 Tax=Phaffia rhodozyma TaxID=264483 RepID=A0A0F7SWW7_PHARH|nr:E [Phaffia rhodozyma] [Phaffia rhodozyma]